MRFRRFALPGIVLLVAVSILGIGASDLKLFPPLESNALIWRFLGDQNQPSARHENGYIEVNGNFYLLGGRSGRRTEVYDPTDSTWSNRTYPPISQIHHFQAVAIGDTVYIVSAYTDTYPDETVVDRIYKYATNNDNWVLGSVIPASRRRASGGVALHNGKIYLVGGSTGGHGTSAVRYNYFDEYDPATDTWTTLPNAPHTRDHVQAAVIGDKLYVAGGRNGNNGDTIKQTDVYNFNTGQWTTLPSPSGDIPTQRAGAASIAVGHHVVVIGGESTQTLAHNQVEALNTLTNTWVSMQRLNTGRHGTQAIYYNDDIYIVAGAGEQGGSPELNTHEILETSGQTNLPVELAPDFSARVEDGVVVLSWRTLSETNNAGFEVQHLTDQGFEKIGFVNGGGTSASTQSYKFTVSDLPPGRHVFRLKQIDFNGSFELGPQTTAMLSMSGSYFLSDVYPNPLNPQARFTLTLAREQQVEIQVFDMLGRKVVDVFDGLLLPHEPHSFMIDASSWAGGKYILVAQGPYFSSSKPFTVLK